MDKPFAQPLTRLPSGSQGIIQVLDRLPEFERRMRALGLIVGAEFSILQGNRFGVLLIRVQERRIVLTAYDGDHIFVQPVAGFHEPQHD